jgi:succinylglutamate desuccinylase
MASVLLENTSMVKSEVVLPVISEGDHVIGAFVGRSDGPTLIVVGSLHGNEPAGSNALRGMVPKISRLNDKLDGRVYFLIGNTRALPLGSRFIDADLNRHWTQHNLSNVGLSELLETSEGVELTEIDQILDGILVTAMDEVFVLDLHSTSADGVPFATVGDTLRNRNFAQQFPVRILLGIEEQLDGTMLEYLNNAGAVTLGFEGGQHHSDETVSNHTSMVWLALENAGILSTADVPELELHRRRLTVGKRGKSIIEVRHREAITDEDGFEMDPGYNNFDPIRKGQVLAKNKYGPIRAVESGMVLMPLYQKLGNDGFFIGREISPFWLWLSGLLRGIGIQRMIHFLPGVRRDQDDAATLIIDTRIARLFPLQIFHLLGFRRRRWAGNKLVVSRRKHDTSGPFKWRGST